MTKKKARVIGPVFRISKTKPPKMVGILSGELEEAGETIYESPDFNSSSVGYSASYAAAYDRIFNKPKPEELN